MLVLLEESLEKVLMRKVLKMLTCGENAVRLAALKLFARINRAITNLRHRRGKGVVISIDFACLSYLCRSTWLEEYMWGKKGIKKTALCYK